MATKNNAHAEMLASLFFSYTQGVGPLTFQKLIEAFGSAHAAYRASLRDLCDAIGPRLGNIIHAQRSVFSADRTHTFLVNKCIQVLCHSSPQYPSAFHLLDNPPICLYAIGDADLLSHPPPILAIIGTRKPTTYGMRMTSEYVRELAEYKLKILSGLAIGIDAFAHECALKANIPAIAVLGSGLLNVVPRINLRLYNSIIHSGGLVVSEYPHNTSPTPGTFPARNRLIAALADGLLVIEGGEQSGTRITGSIALQGNADVFAIPGSLESPMSWTPHFLIQHGAHLISSPAQIAELMKLREQSSESTTPQLIVNALSQGPRTLDNLAQILDIHPRKLLATLTQLEMKGSIMKRGEMYVVP